ncbi:MAG: universal stress protein [Armatimonadetes bacterium]|nr:universal stress protein [Armatimonadota bacterium]MDE2207249.1 universal stress protein [Armatimonadota bacterium]
MNGPSGPTGETDGEKRSPMESGAGRSRGRLKVFLGFAAGVGKTFEMLNEANRRVQRGQDVVIGFVETHARAGTAAQIGDLETVPRRRIEYRGATFEEMDALALLQRRPQWALVDELAHTNAPGSLREKRWQDVGALLQAGINVATTLNVQHLESLNDTVFDITGIRVRETVPDDVVRQATEIKLVDITPRALIHRLERGDIYAGDRVHNALNNWFREGNLNALREIALREVAHEVDDEVEAWRHARNLTETWATHDRVLVCIDPDRPSLRLLRRGWKIAQRLHGEITAVFVERTQPSTRQLEILKSDFALADRLNVPVVTLYGDVAAEIVRYAREHQITQVVLGQPEPQRFTLRAHGTVAARVARDLQGVDILLVGSAETGA